jgi:hypothetical protein
MLLDLVFYLILNMLNKIQFGGVLWLLDIRDALYSQVLLGLF